MVVFVGLPGSGKSTLAKAVQRVIPKSKRTSFGDQVRSYVGEKGWAKTQANDIRASQHFAKNPRELVDRVIRKIRDMGADWTLIDGARESQNVDVLRKHFDVTVVSVEVAKKERFKRMLLRQRFVNETEATLEKRDQRELGLGVAELIKKADMRVGDTPLFGLATAARVLSESLVRGTKTKPAQPLRLAGKDWAYQLENLRTAAEAMPTSGRARFLSKTLLGMTRVGGGPNDGFVIIRDIKAESAPWQKDHLLAIPSTKGEQPVWLHQVKSPQRLGRMARRLGNKLQGIHRAKGGFAEIALWVNLPGRISMPVLHLHAAGRQKAKRFPALNRANYRTGAAKSKGAYQAYEARRKNSSVPFLFVAKAVPKTDAARDKLVGLMMMDAGITATAAGVYDGRVEVSIATKSIVVRVVRRSAGAR